MLPCLLIAAFFFPPAEAPLQTAAPVQVYFYLSIPDRSTFESWRGNRLDLPVLAEWVEALETALSEGTASFFPVEERKTADIVVEIRRCQVQEDGQFVIGGLIDPDARAVPFELYARHTPNGLRMSLSAFSEMVNRILENR